MPSKFPMPEHGEVDDIGGSKIISDVKENLSQLLQAPYESNSRLVLPDELLYDDLGLPIWNEIIFTPEFYQTHDDIAIFDRYGIDVAARVQPGVTMIDLGAGDTRKVEHLLAAFETTRKPTTYLALDISKSSLEFNVGYLKEIHSHPEAVVKCAGMWGTFEDGLRYTQQIKGPRLFLSLGSVLCNDAWPEALRKVKSWASILREDDFLLVGMDAHLVPRDNEKIWKAYHTRDDLYRQFFLNGFSHANRLMEETIFQEEDWEFEAELENPTRHRFFFRARRDVRLGRGGRTIFKGEEIDWFDSHKYSQDDVETMFDKAGLVATDVWQAPGSEFRQYLVKLKGRDQRGDADSAVSGLN